MLERTAVTPGFADPVFDSQSVFRKVMDAMARPGTMHGIDTPLLPPGGLGRTAAALLLTLTDFETPVWLDSDLASNGTVAAWIRFHCGASVVDNPAAARFAVAGSAALPPLSCFFGGSDEYPDESATVIIQVDVLEAGSGPQLTGPGIADAARIDPRPLGAAFWRDAVDNAALFPRGVDVVFAAPSALAALPRSTHIDPEA